jgi:hypothetical protein
LKKAFRDFPLKDTEVREPLLKLRYHDRIASEDLIVGNANNNAKYVRTVSIPVYIQKL